MRSEPEAMDQNVLIAIVVVVLIAIGYYYYQYQYSTSCPLKGGTPVAGQSAFCQRDGTPAIGPGSAGQWISGSGATTQTVGDCAAHCASNPSCDLFQWNSNNKACALSTFPSAAAANTGVIPVSGYISGTKLTSRAHPWGST